MKFLNVESTTLEHYTHDQRNSNKEASD